MRKFNQEIKQKIVNFWRRSLHSQWLLLLVWIAIATGLRLTNLADKPPWTDEFSTLVFSLGNSFEEVPLNQAIAPETLLQPLQPNLNADIKNVVDNLLTHSNHPPVYFILTHWWMQLFSSEGELVSLWGGRCLSTIFSVASIPAIYGLGRLAFHSRLVGQLAAAIMAVSPYGIYLAQEARHYSLAILFVIASFACLIVSIRHLQQGQFLPIFVALIWVIINSLGMATHYFFTLTICAEAMVLISLVLWKIFDKNDNFFGISLGKNYHRQLSNKNFTLKLEKSSKFTPDNLIKSLASFYIVIFGTLAGALIWLPFWKNGYSSELTKWISSSDSTLKDLFSPIFQFLATGITMLFLLPIESPNFTIAIISAVGMILLLIWIFTLFINSIIASLKKSYFSLSTITFSGLILATTILFFSFTYILDIDLTRGARYSFVYFPAVIILVAKILAQIFHQKFVQSKFFHISICTTTGKKTVILVWLIALFSSLTVVSNLGYQKYYRPDTLVSLIQKTSDQPVLIATTHHTHVETGELMGIAWNIQQNLNTNTNINLVKINFLLIHQKPETENPIYLLQEIITKQKQPLDLWLLNFQTEINLKPQNCQAESQKLPPIDGYNYQLYHCQ